MTFPRVLALVVLFASTVYAQREIGSIDFDGAATFSHDELRAVIQSQETPWALWKWLNSINSEIGNPPQFFDPLVLEADLWSLRRFYDDQGFHRATVDTSLSFTDDRVSITFRISEGPRAVIDSVHVGGVSDVPPAMREEVRTGALIKPGDPLVLSTVEAEFRRLIALFSNYGYVNVNAVAKQAVERPERFHFVVRFDFETGPQYLFGPVEVLADSNSLEPVDPAVVRRHLDYREGDLYSESQKLESERLLNRLGIFDATRIENAAPAESTGRVAIPTRVTVRTRSFQELAPEIGLKDEETVGLSVLAGLGYQHRNFLGDARNLTTSLSLSLRSISSSSLKKLFSSDATRDRDLVTKAEVTTQLIQPYFFSNKVSLSASLSGIWDKQKEYYVPVLRTKMGVMAQTATYSRLFADWNLEWSDPRSVVTQQDTTLPDLYERQFNSILTLTLQRDGRNDLFAPSEGSFQSITFEEAGQLPKLIRGLLDTKVPFSQYVRIIALGQYYVDPGDPRGTTWAVRLRVGAAELYGNSPADVPIYRKFFGGGSSSIRGWKARELGAMTDPAKGGNALIEASLEARLRPLDNAGEFLFLDLRKLSFVLFGDAGNVWTRARNVRGSEVALAAGFGLRYDTVAGPIRIDFGMKVYDPQVDQNRWISDKRFFPETFAGGIIHLGIGQAF